MAPLLFIQLIFILIAVLRRWSCSGSLTGTSRALTQAGIHQAWEPAIDCLLYVKFAICVFEKKQNNFGSLVQSAHWSVKMPCHCVCEDSMNKAVLLQVINLEWLAVTGVCSLKGQSFVNRLEKTRWKPQVHSWITDRLHTKALYLSASFIKILCIWFFYSSRMYFL